MKVVIASCVSWWWYSSKRDTVGRVLSHAHRVANARHAKLAASFPYAILSSHVHCAEPRNKRAALRAIRRAYPVVFAHLLDIAMAQSASLNVPQERRSPVHLVKPLRWSTFQLPSAALLLTPPITRRYMACFRDFTTLCASGSVLCLQV